MQSFKTADKASSAVAPVIVAICRLPHYPRSESFQGWTRRHVGIGHPTAQLIQKHVHEHSVHTGLTRDREPMSETGRRP
jgi:hypothetical protein